jgi:peptidoglycan/LPS O-acetylase OafA/YrhL
VSATAEREPLARPDAAPRPGRPHYALFDALRGIAVVAVVAFHVASITGKLGLGVDGRLAMVLGAQAVIVFFVISGFLLYRPYVAARAAGRAAPGARLFAKRRVLRILPAYWVALTLLALYPGIEGPFSAEWWRFYGFLQLYSPEHIDRGIPVAWTLCVEVTFYAMLPVWALAVRRIGGPWARAELAALAAAALGGAVLQVLAARQVVSDVVANSLPGQMPWLCLGMALAVASVAVEGREHRVAAVRLVVRRPAVCWAAAIAALAGLTALVPEGGLTGLIAALNTPQPAPEAIARIVLSAVLAAGFVLPAVWGESAGGLPRTVLALAPVAFLGTVSYSLYLYHLTIAQLLGLEADPAHFTAPGLGLVERLGGPVTPVLLALTLAVSAAVAALSYRFVEWPFLRRKG